MSLVAYRAWDLVENGEVEGEVEVEGAQAVESVLGDRFVVLSSAARQARDDAPALRGERVRPQELASAFVQLASLTRAGVLGSRALRIVAREHAGDRAGKALDEIARAVERGASVTAAFAAKAAAFGEVVAAIVEAGEEAGSLSKVFDELAVHFSRRAEARREVRSALAYPAAVLCVAAVALSVIVFVVAPKFEAVYKSFSSQLPAPTRVLLGISDAFVSWWYLVALAAAVCVAGWRVLRSDERWRRGVDWAKLRAPLLKRLWRLDVYTRVADVMATLVSAKVPLPRALGVAGRAAGNVFYRDALEEAKRKMEGEGPRLAEALGGSGLFPDDMLAVVEVAETTGELDVQLDAYREMASSQLLAFRRTLRSTIEPFMALGLGAVLGAAIIILYLPIFSLANVIR